MNLLILFLVLLGVGVALRALLPMTLRVLTRVSVVDLRPLAAAFDARMVPYMQANYSGDPAQLESAVRGLLMIAREIAALQPNPVDEGVLYTMIETLVAGRKFAGRSQVRAALDRVLQAESGERRSAESLERRLAESTERHPAESTERRAA